MLSPVMIFVIIPASESALKVEVASYLSLLTKVTTPEIEVFLRNYYRFASVYILTSSVPISLNPNPILRKPENDNFLMKSSKPWNLSFE